MAHTTRRPTAAAAPEWLTRIRVRPQRRHLLIVAGLWIAIVGNAEARGHGIGIGTVILFSLLPSLPLVLGIGQPKGRGRVATRIVPLFNATHQPLLPMAVFGLGVTGILPAVGFVGALAWLGAIVIAWGLGDGLREADGSVRAGVGRLTSWPRLAHADRATAA